MKAPYPQIKIPKFLVFASLLALPPTFTFAQTNNLENILGIEESLGLVHYVELQVIDSVSGGCWLNADRIKQDTRLKLEKNGIGAYTEEVVGTFPEITTLVIHGFGGRTSGKACAGTISVVLTGIVSETYKDKIFVGRSKIYESLFFAHDTNLLDQHFSNAVNEATSEMIADSIKAKRKAAIKALLNSYGDELKEPPKTREELIKSLR